MFPITSDLVAADRSRRLEGYRRWSHRRGEVAGADLNDAPRPVSGHHRPSLRAAFGR